jgi:hypothetical protein
MRAWRALWRCGARGHGTAAPGRTLPPSAAADGLLAPQDGLDAPPDEEGLPDHEELLPVEEEDEEVEELPMDELEEEDYSVAALFRTHLGLGPSERSRHKPDPDEDIDALVMNTYSEAQKQARSRPIAAPPTARRNSPAAGAVLRDTIRLRRVPPAPSPHTKPTSTHPCTCRSLPVRAVAGQ